MARATTTIAVNNSSYFATEYLYFQEHLTRNQVFWDMQDCKYYYKELIARYRMTRHLVMHKIIASNIDFSKLQFLVSCRCLLHYDSSLPLDRTCGSYQAALGDRIYVYKSSVIYKAQFLQHNMLLQRAVRSSEKPATSF